MVGEAPDGAQDPDSEEAEWMREGPSLTNGTSGSVFGYRACLDREVEGIDTVV